MVELAEVMMLMGVPAAFLATIGYLNRRDARLHPTFPAVDDGMQVEARHD